MLLWGGTWLAGDRARLRRERMAELEERALRAEREAERERRLAAAEERARIARDLHDSAGSRDQRDPRARRAGAPSTERRPRRGARGVRDDRGASRARPSARSTSSSRVLREDARRRGRGEVEPPPGLAALDALVQRHRGRGPARDDRDPRASAVRSPRAWTSGAYRILQEALTNAARHGAGTRRGRGRVRPERARGHGRQPGRPDRTPRARSAAGTGSSACASARRCSAAASRRACATVASSVHARLPLSGRRDVTEPRVRVLIVDDDDLMRAGLRGVLASDAGDRGGRRGGRRARRRATAPGSCSPTSC